MTRAAPVADRSISFSAPMVLALLAGRKTQTRRLLKPQPQDGAAIAHGLRCPYGTAGQRLWVREAFRLPVTLDPLTPSAAGALAVDVGHARPAAPVEYVADGLRTHWDAVDTEVAPGRWRSPMFMPRWASRLTLTVTDVRVERLATLTPSDALAEGVTTAVADEAAVNLYRDVWERLRGVGSWQADPWVWVLSFRVDSAD